MSLIWIKSVMTAAENKFKKDRPVDSPVFNYVKKLPRTLKKRPRQFCLSIAYY